VIFGIFKSRWTRAVENSADFIAKMFDLYCGRIPATALRDPYCIGFFQMVGVHVASQYPGNVGSMEKPARAFEECLKLCAPRQAAEIATLLRSLRVEGSPNSGAFLSGRKDGDLYMGWRLLNLGLPREGQAAVVRTYTFADVPAPGTTTSFRIIVFADREPSGSVYVGIRFRLRP
jgi:hypothetical protein